MKLLDLFSGAGGAAVGYRKAGFGVVGVDIVPQPHYMGDHIVADALDVLANHHDFVDTFDAIHASPPCQLFSAYRRKDPSIGAGYPNLIAEVRRLLCQTGKPYVIENIPRAPLEKPITLCGSSFGLDLRRHRLFESNVPLVAPPCNHAWQTPRFPQATNRANLRSTVEVGAYRCEKLAPQAMRLWWLNSRELSEAIPPAYTKFLGRQIYAYLRARHEAGVPV